MKTDASPTSPQPIGASLQVANPKSSGRVQACIGFAALLSLAFIKPLISLAVYSASAPLFSYIITVPFCSAYFLYLQRKQLPKEYASSPVLGTITLLAGLAALAAAWRLNASAAPPSHNDYLSLMAVSFVSLLATGGFAFLGRRWMAAAAFPVAFLIFLAPLPDRALLWIETALQLASAEAASLLFTLSGTPVLRDGVAFQLPGVMITVAQECSGIQASWVLFVSSLIASHLFLKSPWRRVVLVAAVIPLGILRNGFRILVIALLCVNMGPHMIHSTIHRRGGPVFLALSLIPLALLLWWLRKGDGGLRGKRD